MALKSRIPQAQDAIRRRVAVGVASAAGMVADLARQLCPVDTGALRASIRVEPAAPALVMHVKAGGGAVDYAQWVEWGNSRSAAQPFLTPAARAISVSAEVRKALRGR